MISIVFVLALVLILGVLPNSMNILAISGIIVALSIKYKNLFRKGYLFYISSFIISIVSLYFIDIKYFEIVNSGLLGYGFIFLVMIAGLFPNKLEISRVLKKNRGTFSIIGFIFITPHAMSHIFGMQDGINLFGIAAYVIMVPLTITSFRIIRNEIDVKDWIRIQKAAYLVYITLFVHLLVVSSWENKVIYAIIFTIYINNKILKELKK